MSRVAAPCEETESHTAMLSKLAQTALFAEARNTIAEASTDGKEHSVVFGKDAAGKDCLSAIRSGGLKNGADIEADFHGAFADMHNHPGNTVPSTGDIYNLIRTSGSNPLHHSRITLLENGNIYAIAVFNRERASAFIKNHPAEHTNGFSPRFPDEIFNEFAALKSYLINVQHVGKMTADEMTTAYILDKYQSGVALFRLLNDSTFARVYITQEIALRGDTTYRLNICR